MALQDILKMMFIDVSTITTNIYNPAGFPTKLPIYRGSMTILLAIKIDHNMDKQNIIVQLAS